MIRPTRRKVMVYPAMQPDLINVAVTAAANKTDYAGNGGSNPILIHGPYSITCLTSFPNCGVTWGICGITTNLTTQQVAAYNDAMPFNGATGVMSQVTAGAVADGLAMCFLLVRNTSIPSSITQEWTRATTVLPWKATTGTSTAGSRPDSRLCSIRPA